MLNDIFIFAVSLFMVIQAATLATKYAARLAESFGLSKYTIGFFIVAGISIMPETFITLNAVTQGLPSFGLGVLFGAGIADLTLVFAVLLLLAGRGLKIESRALQSQKIYPFLLIFPIILGLDGHFSRIEGVTLILVGVIFYYFTFKNNRVVIKQSHNDWQKNFIFLLLSTAVLLIGSHFTVNSATSLAYTLGVSPVLIGILIVGVGTTMPEFFFSLKSIREKNDSMAIGDILGTVLTDSTIVLGVIALLNPFSFPPKIIYVTGTFLIIASFILFNFMRSGKTLSRREGLLLFLFWIIFILVEFIVNK